MVINKRAVIAIYNSTLAVTSADSYHFRNTGIFTDKTTSSAAGGKKTQATVPCRKGG